MTPTSDERCEVAERMRTLADGENPMTECSVDALYIALGLPYSGTGIECAVIGYLADLIDPTCRVSFVELIEDEVGLTVGWEFNLTCGHTAEMPWNNAPAYCPHCGARVAEDDGE